MFFCFLWDNDNEAWDLGALDAGDGSVPNMAERGALDTCLWDLQVCSVRSGGTGSTAAACGLVAAGSGREEEWRERIIRVSCFLLICFAVGLCTPWAVVYWARPF
jgi:hypothetical protein